MQEKRWIAWLAAALLLVGACASGQQEVEGARSTPPNPDELVGTWTCASLPGTSCQGEITFRSDATFSQWLRCQDGSGPIELTTSGEWSMRFGRLVMVTLQSDRPERFGVGESSTCQVESMNGRQAVLINNEGQRYTMVRKNP